MLHARRKDTKEKSAILYRPAIAPVTQRHGIAAMPATTTNNKNAHNSFSRPLLLGRCASISCVASMMPNDPSSATRRTGRVDCNHDAPAGFAAADG